MALIEHEQELDGVGDVIDGRKHALGRAESAAVEGEIELHAPDIDVGASAGEQVVQRVFGLSLGVVEASIAVDAERPCPGFLCGCAPRFDRADGIKQAGRQAPGAFGDGDDDSAQILAGHFVEQNLCAGVVGAEGALGVEFLGLAGRGGYAGADS